MKAVTDGDMSFQIQKYYSLLTYKVLHKCFYSDKTLNQKQNLNLEISYAQVINAVMC